MANVQDTDLAGTGTGQGAAMVGWRYPQSDAQATTLAEVRKRVVSVMDFVTASDRASLYAGTPVDIAYAYNAATLSSTLYSSSDPDALHRTILAPTMPHKILETVNVRLGQTLVGPGWGPRIDCEDASGDIFVLGEDSAGTLDPFGPPAEIRAFRTHSGDEGSAIVRNKVPGSQITDMFMTSVGEGIVLEEASDVVVDHIVVDQGGAAIRFGGNQAIATSRVSGQVAGVRNFTVSNFIAYNLAQGLIFNDWVYDGTFTNVLICYPRVHGIYFDEYSIDGETASVGHCRNLNFVGGGIICNSHTGDYASMEAAIRVRCPDVQATFTAFHIRRWREYALLHDAGGGLDLHFNGCVWDGQPTDQLNYSESGGQANTTGKGYKSGAEDRVTFASHTFANIPGQVIETTGTSPLHLTIEGGHARGNGNLPFLKHGNTNTATRIHLDTFKGDESRQLLDPSSSGGGQIYIGTCQRWTDSITVSSAATITLPKVHRGPIVMAYITGTTSITAITADPGLIGKLIVLRFESALTFTNGGVLKLAGNFSATNNDTITLMTDDGTYFFEVARSAN